MRASFSVSVAHSPESGRVVAAWRPAVLRCRSGIAALEFAIVVPLLLLLMLGVGKFGIAIKDYLILTAAAQQGAQTLALSRGTTTAYTNATTAIDNAAPTLVATDIGVTMTVNGTACTAATCSLSTPGQTALVTLSYPCDLSIMGTNFGSASCQISAQTAAVVQ